MSKNINTDRVFPVGIGVHLLIFILAFTIGLWSYQLIISHYHSKYKNNFANTQVVPAFLENYAQSTISRGDSNDRIKPRDLANIMIVADIAQEREYDNPNFIYDIENGGPAAYIASAISQNDIKGTGITILQSMQGEVANETDKKVSTLRTIVAIYSQIANQFDNNKNDEGSVDETVIMNSLLERLIDNNHCPFVNWVCSPFSKKANKEISSVGNNDSIPNTIKSIMKQPFGFYSTIVGTNDAELKLCKFKVKDQKASCDGKTISLNSLDWFKLENDRLSESVFKLSYFLIKEIYGSSEVKKYRFIYHALKGPIQASIYILIFFIALHMLWRRIACYKSSSNSDYGFIHMPYLYTGAPVDIDHSYAASRTMIEQLLNSLPLIGLFGTVIGIIGALPNAAAAVSGTGPGVEDEISNLFEQLGLAFSTTAMAITGLLILEFMWVRHRNKEIHALNQIFSKQSLEENGKD